MQFNLYVNNSEKNAIRKNLTRGDYYEGVILGETSLISPTFRIAAPFVAKYNYLYCPEFDRYYFISNITSVRNGLWDVECSVDVLMSFQNQILALKCIVDKQQGQFDSNVYLNDGSFVADSRVGLEVKNFPNGFLKDGLLILVTIGPGGGAPT